jgi:hypothetical protein
MICSGDAMLNDLFSRHDLCRVEVFAHSSDGRFKAVRGSTNIIRDNIYGDGATPEAAIADLIAKVDSTRKPVKPKPVEEVDDLLGDLLG